MVDNQEKFIPQLAIDNECFRSVFTINGAESVKGSHRLGDRRIFIYKKNHRAFNKDLLNEPNFGRIHLAGKYL
jgi:hypothetical protein